MNLYVDTCVLPRSRLETGRIYRERFGPSLGFELLMMFDLPEFEEDLKKNLGLFAGGPLIFHEPVWGVEHSAPKGSMPYIEGMYHLKLTKKYADILHPSAMVYHLNNCIVKPEMKDEMLRTSLENLEEIRGMFPDVKILVENTGQLSDGTMLLNQGEFIDLCRSRHLPVLVDVGHANANGWDIPQLIRVLKDQICGYHLHNNDGLHDLHNRIFDGTLDMQQLMRCIDEMTPEAFRVIEYTRPLYHGDPLAEDIEALQQISRERGGKFAPAARIPGSKNPLNTEQMQYVLSNMADAVCVAGMNGELLYTNSEADKLFGISGNGKKKLWDVISYEEKNDGLIQLFISGVMNKQKSLRAIVDYVNNEGTAFKLHVSLTCDAEGSGMIIVVITNLTDTMKLQTSLERYLSPEIADYVLATEEGARQGGQEHDVSILMSDLRGFTAMSTWMPSADLVEMLNHYFEKMAAVIRYYQGTIIEFLGDGIFVVFGAPIDLKDHAAMAVSCAIRMQNAMAEVNAWNRERHYPELAMGIGISSGTCVIGNIGSQNKMKYGCIGETVNLAGRMETFSIGGQIHISESTRDMISEELTIIGEKAFMPKGGKTEMKIYNVTAIGNMHLLMTSEESTAWEKLDPPAEFTLYILDGKTVDVRPHKGSMTAISVDRRYARIQTPVQLRDLQDLMITFGGEDMYAKVTECTGTDYRIGFTLMLRKDESGPGSPGGESSRQP